VTGREEQVAALAGAVSPADEAAAGQARRRHHALAKPPGSLGAVEQLGARLAAVAGRCPPPVPAAPAVVVAAGDHGVHAQGVTPWPQSVTSAMVGVFCQGRAAVNAIAAVVGARVAVLDVGVAGEPVRHPRLRRARVRDGTADLSEGPAMTRDEAAAALLAGAGLAEELVASGVDLLVTGDMGIANTTAAACLVAAFTGAGAAETTGPGAGADAAMLARKTALVAAAVARHGPGGADPLGTLAALGGLEHAALAGVILSGACDRVPVVLDGVNTAAAALAAVALCPPVRGYLVAGHRSTEPGAAVALDHLGLPPLLDLGLRLGEGTGGLLAVPVVAAAARVLNDVAAIDEL
jgi:nicotinate-nucleotide--dimethylbenzimidazole phosphoribosyltransferase